MTARPRGGVLQFIRLLPPVRRVARRPPVPPGTAQRWLFFQIARRFTPLIASDERDGARFIVRTSDAIAGEQLFIYGGSDDRDVLDRAFAVVRALAKPAGEGKSPTGVLLEIGANIGTTTVAALRGGYVHQVVAIEAHPETARLLQQNVIANGVADRVRVIHAAVTDTVGQVELALSDIDSGDHRVRPRDGTCGEIESRSQLAVPAITVDALVQEGTVDLKDAPLVWIDAQGHEPAILRGGQSLLQSGVPVLIEYWPEALRASGGLEQLEELVASSYSRFVDLRASADPASARPSTELPALRDRYQGESFTDLLLLKE
jgi:FkbM family methyltransferase